MNTADTRSHVHELIDRLPPGQLSAIETLLESMFGEEELTEEDKQALRLSDQYFRRGGLGISLEQVAAGLGFTIDEISAPKKVAQD